ncbi:hypothetical protein CC85DRAFT_270037 [Cutaneotrichosporon oleaginosum]|uniref:Uncharacterized protein n=1 Tax=Cutaneotrichosporon oleaginosum TaxID=879819 RepID=A0A0J0XVD9_9TREE|nr:uncharacterized protein CC85DRAFT_270037 [Cutaneotrichosporon oleaginosum]KLT45023.1 hypothetical protein CC85DRAFT_270037 [Cutaneotrichosporon oleaginosum]TXT09711.1 hypothetical protein COLE_03645 [Cutaneotrichosporon oleaginosum]
MAEEDSQRPHYRPLLKTRSRIEFRGISLVERGTAREVPPPQTPKISGALDRGMFPTRRRRIPEEERAAEELKKAAASKGTSTPLRRSGRRSQAAPTVADLTADPGAGPSVVLTTGGVEAEMVIDLEEARRGDIADEDMAEDAPEDTADSSPGKKRSPSKGKSASKAMPKPKPKPSPKAKPKTKGKGKEKATDDVEMAEESETPAPAPVEEVEEDLEAQTSEIDVTPTVVRRRGGPGRPRGRRQDPSTPRMVRAAVAVSSLADLADIAYAGGLGPSNIRLDVAPNADAELLAAVAAVRKGQPWTPGSKLTPSQEERLLRNLPASGPGSRGGRRGSGVGRGRGRGRGRPATRRRPLHSSGMGLGDDFFGVGSSKDGAENAENDEGEEDDGDHFEDDDGEEGEHEEMEVDES